MGTKLDHPALFLHQPGFFLYLRLDVRLAADGPVSAAAFYNLSGIADSSIYSTALTELVEPRYIGAAYAIRSVMGFGAGAVSPWVFGLIMDMVRGGPLSSEPLAWGLAWTSLGLGASPGPAHELVAATAAGGSADGPGAPGQATIPAVPSSSEARHLGRVARGILADAPNDIDCM